MVIIYLLALSPLLFIPSSSPLSHRNSPVLRGKVLARCDVYRALPFIPRPHFVWSGVTGIQPLRGSFRRRVSFIGLYPKGILS